MNQGKFLHVHTSTLISNSLTVDIHAGLLYSQLKHIFPYECILRGSFAHLSALMYTVIQTNVRKEHKIKFPSSNSYMELDFYIQTCGLCFEFQVTLSLSLCHFSSAIPIFPLHSRSPSLSFSCLILKKDLLFLFSYRIPITT
jgi:hypothetical protein